MPQAGRPVIDGYEFARGGGEISGSLSLADLPRLAELGVAEAPEIAFAVRGGINERGKPALHVHAAGSVAMTCQRCLGRVAVPLAADAELELAASEEEVAAADDDVDRVAASPAMDLVTLVEDELILALPMVARHADCGPREAAEDGRSGSPFAGLADLKARH